MFNQKKINAIADVVASLVPHYATGAYWEVKRDGDALSVILVGVGGDCEDRLLKFSNYLDAKLSGYDVGLFFADGYKRYTLTISNY